MDLLDDLDKITPDEAPADNETIEESTTGPRRSLRERRPPDFFGVRVNTVNELHDNPSTIEDALASSDKSKWLNAMQNEMRSLDDNVVWELVELPEGQKTIGSN